VIEDCSRTILSISKPVANAHASIAAGDWHRLFALPFPDSALAPAKFAVLDARRDGKRTAPTASAASLHFQKTIERRAADLGARSGAMWRRT
jgi:hypothetical protein